MAGNPEGNMGTVSAEYCSAYGVSLLHTTTVIYLNNPYVSDTWELKKKDFFSGKASDSFHVSSLDEVFAFHLLEVHANSCKDPSCNVFKDSKHDKENANELDFEKHDIQNDSHSPTLIFPEEKTDITIKVELETNLDSALGLDNSKVFSRRSLPGSSSPIVNQNCQYSGSTCSLNKDVNQEEMPMVSSDASHDQTEGYQTVIIKTEPVDVSDNSEIQEEGRKERTHHESYASYHHGLNTDVQNHRKNGWTNKGYMEKEKLTDKRGRNEYENSQRTGPSLSSSPTVKDSFEGFGQNKYLDRKLFECNICSEDFLQKCDFEVHLHTHASRSEQGCTGPKPDDILRTSAGKYQCNVCSKSVSTEYRLYRHLRTHAVEEPTVCSICTKSFCSKYVLASHMRTHTGEKPYQCDICLKSFAIKNNRNKHRRIHTGEKRKKPYSCSVCLKAFSEKSHFTHHMRMHTGEKPFQCDICGRSFSQRGNLKNHIRRHNGEKPFACQICNKPTANSSALKTHMMTHTGEKPFKCNVCSTSFSRKFTLINHMRRHTGEKPFQCHLCSKSFSRMADLRVHLRKHDGEK